MEPRQDILYRLSSMGSEISELGLWNEVLKLHSLLPTLSSFHLSILSAKVAHNDMDIMSPKSKIYRRICRNTSVPILQPPTLLGPSSKVPAGVGLTAS